jgi:hypothetical protein
MKVEVGIEGTIEIRNLYNPITLITDSGESLAICMRDSGFEFKYQGEWYFAKAGEVSKVYRIQMFNSNNQEENGI